MKFNNKSSIPKYRQIINIFIDYIEHGFLKEGDKLPSINEIGNEHNLSRDTVMMAYNELKARGIIEAIPGKGYFVLSTDTVKKEKIFILFDELNNFKEDLYQSISSHLPPETKIDIFFHHFNFNLFKDLISKAAGHYTNYIIMPATFESTRKIIGQLPPQKVLILDRLKEDLFGYHCIYQDFENDTFDAMNHNLELFNKYNNLIMVYPGGKEPIERVEGFVRFCKQNNFKWEIVTELDEKHFNPQTAILLTSNRNLVFAIKTCKSKKLIVGDDIGIVSFNESSLMEVISDGITTISTDFLKMGMSVSNNILNNHYENVKNPWIFKRRNSL